MRELLRTILAVSVALLLAQNPAWNVLSQQGIVGPGAIIFIDGTIGMCPTGWTEISSTGNYIVLTSHAAGDVGTTGGSNSYTPAGSNGTVSFTPAGTNGTVNFTPAGTNGTAAFTPSGTVAWPAGVPTFAGSAMGTHSHGAGTLADATSGSTVKLFTSSGSGVSAATLSGSTAAVSAGTPAGTVAWPAGVPTFSGSGGTVPAQTFTGSSGTVPAETFTGSSGTVPAQTFTGTAATIQPTFVKLIGCRKT